MFRPVNLFIWYVMAVDNQGINPKIYIQKEDPFGRSKFYMNFVRPAWENFFSWIFPIPIVSKLITQIAMFIVFPAGQRLFKQFTKKLEDEFSIINDPNNGRKMCQTFDGAEIWGDEIKADKENAPTMLAFQGNGFFYESSSKLGREALANAGYAIGGYVHEDIAKELEANLVTFNYRGVMHSTGRAISHKDLVVDGIAMVDMLIERGDKKIILCGHSLGGTVSARVMDYFLNNKEGKKKLDDKKVELFYVADRSLKRTDMFVPAILRIAIKPILALAGFDIDIEKEIKKMPKNKRIVIEYEHDDVIAKAAFISTIINKSEVIELEKVNHIDRYTKNTPDFNKVKSEIKRKFIDMVDAGREGPGRAGRQ